MCPTHQTRRERKFSTDLENLYLKMLSLSSRRLIVSSSCYLEHPTIAAHSATWEMFASSSAGWARWRSLQYSSLVSVAKKMQLNKSCKRSRASKYMHVWKSLRTFMNFFALVRRPSVVCFPSAPKGTISLSFSRHPRRWARLKGRLKLFNQSNWSNISLSHLFFSNSLWEFLQKI